MAVAPLVVEKTSCSVSAVQRRSVPASASPPQMSTTQSSVEQTAHAAPISSCSREVRRRTRHRRARSPTRSVPPSPCRGYCTDPPCILLSWPSLLNRTSLRGTHVETLGCPKNAVDSDKVVASPRWPTAWSRPSRPTTPTSSWSTPARSSRPPARSRSTSPWRSPSGASPAPSWSSPAVSPSATATSWRKRSPRPTPSSASVARASWPRSSCGASRRGSVTCSSCPGRYRRRPGPTSRSPRAATGPAPSAPSRLPREAAARGRPSRSRPRCGRSSTAVRREIVLVAQDLAWYGRDAGDPGALAPLLRRLDRLAVRRSRTRAAALPLSERGARPARGDDARAADGRPLLRPLPPARRRRHCSGACGDGEAATASSPCSTASVPREPDAAFRSSFIVGFPGETERDHDAAPRVPRRRRARLGRVLPVLARGRHRRRRLDGVVPDDLALERLREAAELQDPITWRAREALVDPPSSTCSSIGSTPRPACRSAAPPERLQRSTESCGSSRPPPPPASSCAPGSSRRSEPTWWRSACRDRATGGHGPGATVRRGCDRDARQRGHDHAARARRTHSRARVRARRVVGDGAALAAALVHRRVRRLDRAPRRHRPDRGRSSTRSPTRCSSWGASSPSACAATSPGRPYCWSERVEFGISAYRSLASRRGISLPARQLGKWKATLQYVAVGVVLFPPTADAIGLQQVVLWAAVGITLLSALDILRRGWRETKSELTREV